MGNPPDRLPVAPVAHELLDVARVNDQAGRGSQYLAGEWIVGGPVLPERRQELVDDAVGEHPPDRSGLTLHRVQVAGSVTAAQRHTGDEVVEDEIVQDDYAGPAAESLDDPAVRLGVVADVVERDVGTPAAPTRPTPNDVDVDPLRQRR